MSLKLQVSSKHYNSKEYLSQERFNSYFYQIKEILDLTPLRILEIGIGNGFVSNYLKSFGLNVTTLDIDIRLNPDKVGSVLEIPFNDKEFDIVACFQILEHLPYDDSIKALKEIFRVTNKYALISLPDVERCFSLAIKINSVEKIKKYIEIPRKNRKKHVFDGEHYWEIGKNNFSLDRICQDINLVGFSIIRSYRLFENTYHRIFVLDKNLNKNAPILWDRIRIGKIEPWREYFFEENLKFKNLFCLLKIARRVMNAK